jgi:hypothetical protein
MYYINNLLDMIVCLPIKKQDIIYSVIRSDRASNYSLFSSFGNLLILSQGKEMKDLPLPISFQTIKKHPKRKGCPHPCYKYHLRHATTLLQICFLNPQIVPAFVSHSINNETPIDLRYPLLAALASKLKTVS